jgi:hypothetical protein
MEFKQIYLLGANNEDGGFNDVIAMYEQKNNCHITLLNTTEGLPEKCWVITAFDLVQMSDPKWIDQTIPLTRQQRRKAERNALKEAKKRAVQHKLNAGPKNQPGMEV